MPHVTCVLGVWAFGHLDDAYSTDLDECRVVSCKGGTRASNRQSLRSQSNCWRNDPDCAIVKRATQIHRKNTREASRELLERGILHGTPYDIHPTANAILLNLAANRI